MKGVESMADPRIEKFADILVNYSTGLKKGETVIIRAEAAAEELVREVYRSALAAGAHPRVKLGFAGAENIFFAEASDEQIDHLSPIDVFEAEHSDALISIRAQDNTRSMSAVSPEKQARRSRAAKPLQDIVLTKVRWCGTLYPTPAFAQDAEMGTEDFRDFVFRAVFADKADPIAEWRKLSAMQAGLIKALEGKKEFRVRAEGTDIKMSVAGRKWINSDGKHNMPSGEIFTTPMENSAEGVVTFTYPAVTGGREVEGVRLVFKEGRVVEASAKKNENYLKKMIALDEGSCRLGEIGIGTNYGIDRFIKSILYDEKIGGTIHLALGNAYPETGGRNASALHWDMICDLRPQRPGLGGGEILVDGEVFQKDGKFQV